MEPDASSIQQEVVDQPVVPQPVEEVAVDLTGGVPDGTVEKNDHPLEHVRDSIEHAERVVHEFDEAGNVIGFHKEPLN